ncbi:MAG: DNA-binding protein [Methylococcaceae bacterium]|nr:DNA-binding protein [Methylococcaceae bacterium]
MALERIVTDSVVFEIADQLTANGEKVTNRAIWSALGGGSMTTVSQALRRWKEQQEIQVSQPIERAPLPAALVDVLHQAAAQLWQAAQAETKSELEQLAQATNARIAEAQSERDDTLAELQTTAEELEQVKAERNTALSELDSKAKQLTTAITELNTQALTITEATHRADTAEAARAELLARVEQLSELLKAEQAANLADKERHQADTDRAKTEAENARVAEKSCQARLEAAEREIDTLKAQVKEERSAAKQSAETAAELRGRLGVFEESKQAVKPEKPAPKRKPAGEKQGV